MLNDTINTLIEEDLSREFSLPHMLECALKILNASAAPLSLVEQGTVDEMGSITKKNQMMHDQSFPGPSSFSVNK